jgi:tetratricopeptide (TPR) repeat protein
LRFRLNRIFAPRRAAVRRVISWKRFAVVLAILLIATAATFGVHALQSRRNADALRRQAESYLSDKTIEPAKLNEAITLLDKYLKMRPKDEEAYRKYAQIQLDRAKTEPKKGQEAADALEKFLRQFPEHPDERRRLIALYIELPNLTAARQHIRILFDRGGEFKEDVDLLDQAAACEVGLSGDIAQAVKYLDDAIATRKAPPRIVEKMLGLLHGTKAYNDPRFTPGKYLEILLKQDPYRTDVEARVLAGQFLLKTGDLQNARRHITDALAMPGGSINPEALLAAAALERSEIKSAETVQPQLKKARVHLEAAFALDKKNVRVGLALAETLTDQSEVKAAIDVLRTTAEGLGETNDLMLRVVDKLIDLSEQELSRSLIEKIEKNEADKERIVKYFRGRLAVLKSDWPTARKLLEEISPSLVRLPHFHKKSEWGLGQCYAVIQNPDKQLEHNAAALRDDPFYIPGRIGLADAYLKLGKFREALAEYRTIVTGYRLNAFRPAYARLEFRAALMSPVGSRSWDAFETSLGAEADRTADLQILYAESHIARGNLDKAGSILEGVIKKDPKNALAWLTLARIASRAGNAPGGANKLLEDAAKAIGDSVDLRLARSIVLVNRNRKPTVLDFKALSGNLENFEKPERRRLLIGLGEAASRAALIAEESNVAALRNLAIDFLRGAAELDPNDLISRATLVDLGITARRADVVDQSLAEIAKAEGDKGPIGSLALVIRRLPEVRTIADKATRAAAISDLRTLATRAKADRPGWGRAYVVLAQLDELEGLSDSALAHYKDAIDKGERQEFVIRRVVELYRERRQDDQAAVLLNSLHTEIILPDDLERFRAIKDLLARDIPATERPTIDRIAPAESKEWRIQLLRGSLLAAIGADADAQVAFRKAVEFGDYVPETWGALVTHLIRLGKTDDARRATQQVERKIDVKDPIYAAKTPGHKADLIITLAGCQEMIGDFKQAEERYRASVEVAPREKNSNRELILFLKRTGRHEEADSRLRKLTDAPEQDLARWARRYLAISLMYQRDAYPQRTNALQLLERNLAVKPIDQEDVKAKAVVQTIDPLTRADGMKMLREFAKWGDLTPDEYLLLGRLHFEEGKVFESVDYFEQAARPREGLRIEHLTGLIRVYAGINKLGQARATLARLKNFAPRSWDAVREEARLLHQESLDAAKREATEEARKLRDQARELILNYPNATSEESIRLRAGPLLEELGFSAEVETHYTRLLKSKEPNPHFPLAGFLIRQKRTAEAIALAKKYDASSPAAITARILTGAIRSKSPGSAAERDVAVWLDERLKNPKDKHEKLSLMMSKAELYEGTGEYEKAIMGYEDALLLAKPARPDELRDFAPELIANNLAMLLALYRPAEADRAIRLMDEVISIRGPAPAFLDTRAVCYLVKGGKTEEAATDLQLALIQQRKAVYLFHLGWAYDLNPNKRALREQTLDEAKKLGIAAEDLHPMEARKFNELYRSK